MHHHGIRPKHVPPADELEELVEESFTDAIDRQVRAAIFDVLDKDAIVTEVTDSLRDDWQITDVEEYIREKFKQHPTYTGQRVID